MGPSAEQYFRHCARYGSKDLFDELWTVNMFSSIFRPDRVFHMDDVRIQRIRASLPQNENLLRMMEDYKRTDIPIYTSRTDPEYPGLVSYPIEDVLNGTGGPFYFNHTPVYAVALALASHKMPDLLPEPVEQLAIFGCDYAYEHGRWYGEKGRACMEYWLGRCRGTLEVHLPKETWLMDARDNYPYGYDTIKPQCSTDEYGKCVVTWEEVPEKDWPTAEEMEIRYAHK